MANRPEQGKGQEDVREDAELTTVSISCSTLKTGAQNEHGERWPEMGTTTKNTASPADSWRLRPITSTRRQLTVRRSRWWSSIWMGSSQLDDIVLDGAAAPAAGCALERDREKEKAGGAGERGEGRWATSLVCLTTGRGPLR